MIAPGIWSTWRSVCSYLAIVLGIGAGLHLLAWVELSLGRIGIERCMGMLADGMTVMLGGLAVAAVRMARAYLVWLQTRRRMRRNLLSSLSGTPRYAAEGWADPVDAAGLVTPALPDSSAVIDLASHRRQS